MFEQVVQDGNKITFGDTEFVCNLMPKRTSWKLLDKLRVHLGKADLDINALLSHIQTGDIEAPEAQAQVIAFLKHLVGSFDEQFISHVQEVLFRHCEFKQGKGDFIPLSEIVEEMAFTDMGAFDLYILMARCIWVNYQRDILYWGKQLGKQTQEKPTLEPPPQPEDIDK